MIAILALFMAILVIFVCIHSQRKHRAQRQYWAEQDVLREGARKRLEAWRNDIYIERIRQEDQRDDAAQRWEIQHRDTWICPACGKERPHCHCIQVSDGVSFNDTDIEIEPKLPAHGAGKEQPK